MANFFSRTSLVSLDLTGAGAPVAWQRDHDPETELFVMGRLAGLSALADKAGVDLITLDSGFRLGGRRRRDAWLDGALAASRLGNHTTGTVISPSVPLGVTSNDQVASAVASVHRSTAGRGAWQVEAPAAYSTGAESVDAVVNQLRSPAVSRRTGAVASGPAPAVVVRVGSDVDVEIAAARADVARLRVDSVEEARNLRAAIRTAARDWGRDADDVKVLVDVHTLIAPDAARAQARADLLADLGFAPVEGLLQTAGPAHELARLWQNWVRAGAADGFTVIPASVPTDVVALVTEVLPDLRARGLREELAPAATAPAAVEHATRRRAGSPIAA